MQVERYRIILTGWVMSGYQTRDVIAELSRLFKIPEDRIRPLLVGEPSVIRRDLTLEKAERLRNKIEQRGAVCSIKRLLREEGVDSPCDMESTGILVPDLNMDSTQFVSIQQDSISYKLEPFVPRGSMQNIKSRRKKEWRFASIVLLAGVLVTAMVWSYFYLYPESYSSNLTPRVFTFSPAKGVDSAENERKNARP